MKSRLELANDARKNEAVSNFDEAPIDYGMRMNDKQTASLIT